MPVDDEYFYSISFLFHIFLIQSDLECIIIMIDNCLLMNVNYVLIILHVYPTNSYNLLIGIVISIVLKKKVTLQRKKPFSKWLRLELSSGISEYKTIQIFTVTLCITFYYKVNF